jgi:uncharacterized protein (DUF697 family)/predicted GTPase
MKLRDLTTDYWKQLRTALLSPSVDKETLGEYLVQARKNAPLPVLWLLGKTQAGKTSIINALTGSGMAEVGDGIQACTKNSHFYDFPVEAPVVRFLDSRGLGEIAYDPNEDIHFCESQAHLVLAVMKAADLRQEAIFDVLREVRQRHPEWPLVIAQTGLHELYPLGGEHIVPWPYGTTPLPETVPTELQQVLLAQRDATEKLPGTAPIYWVPIDLTLPEEGFEPADYGLEALWQAIESSSSLSLQHLLNDDKAVRDIYSRAAHQHIMGYSLTAAGLGALPVVDLVAVSAVQAKLLHGLAELYEQPWNKQIISEFLGLIGLGIASGYLARSLGRALVKFIPFVGQTIGVVWGASSSGATTYALGKAAVYFFARHKKGLNVDAATLRQIYADALAHGAILLKERFKDKSK